MDEDNSVREYERLVHIYDVLKHRICGHCGTDRKPHEFLYCVKTETDNIYYCNMSCALADSGIVENR